jgi:hypothetical protein
MPERQRQCDAKTMSALTSQFRSQIISNLAQRTTGKGRHE